MSSRSSYRKIQQSETNAEEYEEELKKRTRAERLDRITAKIHAVFWVAAAIAIFIFTDILNVALYNEKVNRYTITIITTMIIIIIPIIPAIIPIIAILLLLLLLPLLLLLILLFLFLLLLLLL